MFYLPMTVKHSTHWYPSTSMFDSPSFSVRIDFLLEVNYIESQKN